MSEVTLAPYRVEPSDALEPIDPKTIPDQAGEELNHVALEIRAVSNRLSEIREADFNRHMKRIYPRALALLLCADFICGMAEVISVGWAIGLVFASALAALFASLISSDFRKPIENEETRALKVRQTTLESREERLRSLERLTGKHDQAMKLLDEVEQFNLDIARLDLQECSLNDVAMIEARRHEIATRIGDFRQKVLDDPGKPLALLPAPSADRT